MLIYIENEEFCGVVSKIKLKFLHLWIIMDTTYIHQYNNILKKNHIKIQHQIRKSSTAVSRINPG